MSNNKQSSVEWLVNQLIEHQIIKVGQTTYGGKVNYKHEILLEQAKAMHKEELEFAFKGGMSLVEGHLLKPIDKFEEFYNQKFNNEQTN